MENKTTKSSKQFNIGKKIAKHRCNSIILISKLLQGELRPKTIVNIQIKIIENNENGEVVR